MPDPSEAPTGACVGDAVFDGPAIQASDHWRRPSQKVTFGGGEPLRPPQNMH